MKITLCQNVSLFYNGTDLKMKSIKKKFNIIHKMVLNPRKHHIPRNIKMAMKFYDSVTLRY